jgi:heme exporter protein D
MYFDSFEAFLQMGKHGPYVWSAYAISFVLILTEVIRAWRRQQTAKKDVLRLIKREQTTQSDLSEAKQ